MSLYLVKTKHYNFPLCLTENFSSLSYFRQLSYRFVVFHAFELAASLIPVHGLRGAS